MENLVSFLDQYAGKKVLLTGHTGFKGSWLFQILKNAGADIVGVSNSIPTNPSHFNILFPNDKQFFQDIRDYSGVKKIFDQFQPNIVFHLAAQSLVRPSYEDPVANFETNILGTVNLLESARHCKSVNAFINVTSDKCYENNETGRSYVETDPMGGKDPYSASKGCVELIHASYRNSFFPIHSYRDKHNCLIASVRAGNVIGGGDWAKDRIIPDIIKAANTNNELIIRNPDSIRPWQHVLEPLYGYLKLGAELLSGNTGVASSFNFGPAEKATYTVRNIVDQAKAFFPNLKVSYGDSKENPPEAGLLSLDSTKAFKELNWMPVYNAKLALKLTFEWYSLYLNEGKVITKNQILEYSAARIKMQGARMLYEV